MSTNSSARFHSGFQSGVTQEPTITDRQVDLPEMVVLSDGSLRWVQFVEG
jgi:hypothetical protein